MNVSCLQENLQRGLAHVARAVATKSTLPVLGNILLATDRGQLKLAATNLEIAITCWVGCQIEEEGAITVPARLLDRFRRQPAQRSRHAPGRPPHAGAPVALRPRQGDDQGHRRRGFPDHPDRRRYTPTARIEPELLREVISQVVFAAATDDSRPVLTGVQVQIEGSRLTMAAADGFRLSVRAADLAEPAPTEVEYHRAGAGAQRTGPHGRRSTRPGRDHRHRRRAIRRSSAPATSTSSRA